MRSLSLIFLLSVLIASTMAKSYKKNGQAVVQQKSNGNSNHSLVNQESSEESKESYESKESRESEESDESEESRESRKFKPNKAKM